MLNSYQQTTHSMEGLLGVPDDVADLEAADPELLRMQVRSLETDLRTMRMNLDNALAAIQLSWVDHA